MIKCFATHLRIERILVGFRTIDLGKIIARFIFGHGFISWLPLANIIFSKDILLVL